MKFIGEILFPVICKSDIAVHPLNSRLLVHEQVVPFLESFLTQADFCFASTAQMDRPPFLYK